MALPTWEQSSLLSRNDILDGESFSRSGIGLLNSTSSSSSNADLIKSLSRRPEFRIVEEETVRHVASKFTNEKSQAKLLSALDRALVDYDDSIISSNHPTRSFLGSKSQHSRFELEEYLQQEAGQSTSQNKIHGSKVDESVSNERILPKVKQSEQSANVQLDGKIHKPMFDKVSTEGKEEPLNIAVHDKHRKHDSLSPIDENDAVQNFRDHSNLDTRMNLLEAINIIKHLTKCVQGIKLSLENDGDIKSKIADFYVEYEANSRFSIHLGFDSDWAEIKSEENVSNLCKSMRRDTQRFFTAFNDCLSVIFEVFKAKKLAYSAQLRQSERLASDSQMKRMTDIVETAKRQTVEELQYKLKDSDAARRSLEIEIQELKDTISTYVAKDHRRLEQQKQAVDDALRVQRESFEETARQQHLAMQEEIRRATKEATAQIEAANNNHKMRIDAQQAHESEIRAIFAAERSRLEDENKKLREQLVIAASDASRERERAAVLSQEDLEKIVTLKNEMAALAAEYDQRNQQQIAKILQDSRLERNKLESEMESRMDRFKDSTMEAHALEVSKMQDSFVAEMKRMKAENDVRHHDDAMRVRHLHEQEMHRLLRENDRLRKIIIRNGGTASFPFDTPTSAASVRKPPFLVRTAFEERIRKSRSKSPAGKSETPSPNDSEECATKPQPPPPPPPLQSSQLGTQSQLDWTSVRRSISDQQQVLHEKKNNTKSPSFSNVRFPLSPPSAFPLDQSLYASNGAVDVSSSISADNAGRVGSYMSKLEEYLQANQRDSISNSSFLSRKTMSNNSSDDSHSRES